VIPHGRPLPPRPTPAPPASGSAPLNPITLGTTSPTPPIARRWAPVSIGPLRRAAPSPAEQPILLAGGANPAEVVNAVNPDRGIVNAAGPDSWSQPPSFVVAGSDGSGGGGAGDDLKQLAFLAGAVFVAWLALRG
jgi:hypothetical protein